MKRPLNDSSFLAFLTLLSAAVFAGEPQYAPMGSVLPRIELNGLWDFRLETRKTIEDLPHLPAFDADDRMIVPGAWDATSRYYNRRGTGCYRTRFTLAAGATNAFLVVDGCCLRARCWLDGRDLGLVALPWSRFALATGPLAAGRHELVAAIDSTVDDAKVALFRNFYDFYPSGGFQHGVWLELQHAPSVLRRVVVRTRDYATGLVELTTEFAGKRPSAPFSAEVAFDGGAARRIAFTNGTARVRVPGFRLWSPESPALHTVAVTAFGQRAENRFGIRQVGTEAGRITLNGRRIYLKGVNRHEAHYEFGATTPKALMYEDLQNLRDLGGNFVRGSHYAQCDEFLTLCDELGVLVWEESLGWGNRAQQLNDAAFRRLQEDETRIMVKNSINHPSIVISAFLNEPDSNLNACRTLVDRLIETIRAEDTGHLVTFACHRTLKDISHARTDLIAYNTYPCWYSHELEEGSEEEMRAHIARAHREIIDYFRRTFRDTRPILVSETGVKADYGVRDPRGRAQYTEDCQAEYTRLMLEEIFAARELAGVAIWQFTDAKTYTRTEGMRNRSYGVNTGGLYDLYRRPKLAVEAVRAAFHAKPADEGPIRATGNSAAGQNTSAEAR